MDGPPDTSGNWYRHTSKSTGKEYYYNPKTEESVYVDVLIAQRKASSSSAPPSSSTSTSTTSSTSSSSALASSGPSSSTVAGGKRKHEDDGQGNGRAAKTHSALDGTRVVSATTGSQRALYALDHVMGIKQDELATIAPSQAVQYFLRFLQGQNVMGVREKLSAHFRRLQAEQKKAAAEGGGQGGEGGEGMEGMGGDAGEDGSGGAGGGEGGEGVGEEGEEEEEEEEGDLLYPPDCPHIAVLRQQYTKTLRQELKRLSITIGSMEKEPAMCYDRWVFVQKLLEDPAFAKDPVLPNGGVWNINLIKEYMAAGVPYDRAYAIVDAFAEKVAETVDAISEQVRCDFGEGCSDQANPVMVQPVKTKTFDQHNDKVEVPAIQVLWRGSKYLMEPEKYQSLYGRYAKYCAEAEMEPNPEDFKWYLFILLVRYEAMGAGSYQAGVPRPAFQVLENLLGVTTECFASPLNATLGEYYSAYIDTDVVFGSSGSFFDAWPESGSFEANPPFVEETMKAMYEHMEEIFNASAAPLSFVVVVPAWTDADIWALLSNSPYLRHAFELRKRKHRYVVGRAHIIRRSKTRDFVAPFGTGIFVLQNDAGAQEWPIPPNFESEFKRGFGVWE